MLLHRPLLTVTPTVDGDVLNLLARADAAFTAPKVQRLLERHSVPGVRKVLNRLVEQGIVNADQVGRTLSYRLNRDHLAAAPIVQLAHLDAALVERIRTAVTTWDQAPLLVMLFGSAATGRMRVDSDIDVFVVGHEPGDASDLWRAQISELELDIRRWTGNDARVLAYTVDDLTHTNDVVVDDIARDGILIAGDRALLRRSHRQAG
ncbi:MAG TPA: nucleotidyltransferase domain-containing protein [Ilumatobacteraceae bacterium]|nr:nucleotidyltransferase domain-containing protein [Ilumatobacteraceae bacterium]